MARSVKKQTFFPNPRNLILGGAAEAVVAAERPLHDGHGLSAPVLELDVEGPQALAALPAAAVALLARLHDHVVKPVGDVVLASPFFRNRFGRNLRTKL
jgi:hypothetical protein